MKSRLIWQLLMKNKLVIFILGWLFSCAALAENNSNDSLSEEQLELLKQTYAPVIQQLKENPPDITDVLQTLNNNDIQEATTEPKQITLDFVYPDFDILLQSKT